MAESQTIWIIYKKLCKKVEKCLNFRDPDRLYNNINLNLLDTKENKY